MKYTSEDKLWSKQVRERDKLQCVICNNTERLNAHHLFPREISELRHDIDNGISLCPKHHRFSRILSAHQNPIAFYHWMENNRAEQLIKIMMKWARLKNEIEMG